VCSSDLIRRQREEQQKRLDFVSDYIGSRTGGSPYAEDMFTGYVPIDMILKQEK